MDGLSHIQLMHLCSNVFPAGMFTHSFGLEGMLAMGKAGDKDKFQEYLGGMIDSGAIRTDTALVRFVYEQPQKLLWWDQLCTALKPAKELRMASEKTGKAFLKAVGKMYPQVNERCERLKQCNYAPVFAITCRELNISIEEALEAYITGNVLSMIQVAIKLIPLSQVDGQIVMKNVYGNMLKCIEKVFQMEEEDVVSFTPMADIAAMYHETLEARMYMS